MWGSIAGLIVLAAYAGLTGAFGPRPSPETARALLPEWLARSEHDPANQLKAVALLAARTLFWAFVLNGLFGTAAGVQAVLPLDPSGGPGAALNFLSFIGLLLLLPGAYTFHRDGDHAASLVTIGLQTTLLLTASSHCAFAGCAPMTEPGGAPVPLLAVATGLAGLFAFAQHAAELGVTGLFAVAAIP